MRPRFSTRARAHIVFAKQRTQGSTRPDCWPGAAPMGVPTPLLKGWDINFGGLLPAPPAAASCRLAATCGLSKLYRL